MSRNFLEDLIRVRELEEEVTEKGERVRMIVRGLRVKGMGKEGMEGMRE